MLLLPRLKLVFLGFPACDPLASDIDDNYSPMFPLESESTRQKSLFINGGVSRRVVVELDSTISSASLKDSGDMSHSEYVVPKSCTIFDLVTRSVRNALSSDLGVSTCFRYLSKRRKHLLAKNPGVCHAMDAWGITVYTGPPDFSLLCLESSAALVRDGETLLIVWSPLEFTDMDLSYGYAELIAKPSQKTIPSACDRGNPVDAFGILAVSGIHNQGKAGLVDLVAPQSEPCEEVVDAKATSKDSRNILDVSAITKDEEPTHSVHEGESGELMVLKEKIQSDLEIDILEKITADQESLPSTSISSGKQDSMKFLNVRGKSPGESSTPVFSGGKNSSAPQISSRPQSVRHPHHPHSSLSVTSSIKSATISEKGGSLSCLRIDGISLHRNLSTSHLLSFPKASESTIFNDSSRSNAKVGYPFAHGPALAVHQDPNLVYLTAVNMITSDEGHCMATVSFENLNRESIDDHGYPVHTESLKVHHSVPWDTVQPGKHEEFSVGHASETIAVVKNIRMESEAFPVKYASNCKDSVPGSLTSRVNGTSLHDLTLLTSESHGDIKRARFNKVSSPIDTKEDEHDSSKIRSPDKQGTKSAVSIRTLSAATISSATRIPKQPQLPETVYQPLTSGPLYQLFTESPLSKASQLDGSNHSGTSIAHQIVPSTSLENNSVRNSETKKSGHTNVSALGHDANLVSSETPASDLSEKQGRVEEFEGKVDQDRVHNAAGSSYTVDFMKTTEGEGAMEVGGSKLSISGSNSVNASTASASTTTAHHTGASALSRSHLEKNSCGSVNKRESGPTASELVDPSAATVATTPAPFAHSQQQDAMSQIKLEPHRSHSNVALKKRLPTKHDSSPILVGDGYKQNKSSKEPSSQDYDGDLFHSKSDADVFKYTPASGTAHTTSTGSLSRQKVLHTTSGRILHGLVTTTQGGGSRGSLAPKGSHGAEDDLTPKAKRKNGGGSSGAIEASALASGSMTGSRDFFKPSNSMADVFSAGRINNDELVTNRTRNEEFGIEDRKGGQNANGSAQAANVSATQHKEESKAVFNETEKEREATPHGKGSSTENDKETSAVTNKSMSKAVEGEQHAFNGIKGDERHSKTFGPSQSQFHASHSELKGSLSRSSSQLSQHDHTISSEHLVTTHKDKKYAPVSIPNNSSSIDGSKTQFLRRPKSTSSSSLSSLHSRRYHEPEARRQYIDTDDDESGDVHSRSVSIATSTSSRASRASTRSSSSAKNSQSRRKGR